MSETITMPKFYSNREISEILGCSPEYIRKLKSSKADELAGFWTNDNQSSETVWNEEGLHKFSELISTDKAKEFRAGKLARRTQEAIAVDRANYGDAEEVSTRTGHEVNSYEVPNNNSGRYSGITKKIGGAIATQMINDGAIEQIDNAVIEGLLNGMKIGDINIEALLGKS